MPRKHVRPVTMIAYTVAKAAAACCMRPERIQEAVRLGYLQTHKIGTKSLILASQLEAWVASHPPAFRGTRHDG